MTAKLKPWKLRAADYSKPGWHTRPTVGYELMFEFLRLSPSYELARKANQEGLTEDDKKLLPNDFNQVLKTYKLLGNVQRYLFRSWWLKRGLKVFGNPHSKPKVHKFGFLPHGVDVSPDLVMDDLEKILSDTRRDEGLGSTLLISVPLGRRKGEVLKEIGRLLDAQVDTSASATAPLIKLEGQRLRAKVLMNGIRLLWIKAAKPKWELWRLGAMARLSKTYSQELDPKSPRKASDKIYDRDMMSKITYRALLKFEAVAENAARGKFPSDAPVDQVTFDYPQLAKIIQRKNMWEDQEKKRLLDAYEARLALKLQLVAEP
ncbi:hypothetical protein [Sapientia aquatica]|uniref:Uncharacterized protein n=1 Tax=Sapientia aquatica TaxID=1549640 RepID=A0A4R5VWH6_9BURK|nr:hypothetical protein [Sapientia aquatica]TDK63700.1 hypothetical protein E2I14_14085 [Sapientia aquatica]